MYDVIALGELLIDFAAKETDADNSRGKDLHGRVLGERGV